MQGQVIKGSYDFMVWCSSRKVGTMRHLVETGTAIAES